MSNESSQSWRLNSIPEKSNEAREMRSRETDAIAYIATQPLTTNDHNDQLPTEQTQKHDKSDGTKRKIFW